MFRTPALNLLIGISAFSFAGILLYIHHKNKHNEDDVVDSKQIKNNLNKKSPKRTNKNSDGEITMQFVLQNDKIPLIIGRGGANLQMIEQKTGTIIHFKEKDDNHQFCVIIGKSESIYEAKELINKDMKRSATVKEEMYVPQEICGQVIGRCGKSLQEICRTSFAKVSIDSGDSSSGKTTQRVVITGNRNQVNIAKNLIENRIKEDENNRIEMKKTEIKREPRRSPVNSDYSLHPLTSLRSFLHLPPREKLNSNENKPLIEVYVSAIASPDKFWLQLIGPQSKQLDELVVSMTEYYNNEENQNLHKIADPYLGQIVSALFKYDGKWYRAEIVGILPNEYNPRDVVLDLYFVDYGDSEYVAPNEVFELRTDFLTLRCQAIECYLAQVKPTNSIDSDIWIPSSITKFEELSHVASWKKLKSRIITYKERPRDANHIRREGSPVPGVELFDKIEGIEINIAHMLISHGYATIDNTKGSDATCDEYSIFTSYQQQRGVFFENIIEKESKGLAENQSHTLKYNDDEHEFLNYQENGASNNNIEEKKLYNVKIARDKKNNKTLNSKKVTAETENFLSIEKIKEKNYFTSQNHIIS